MVKQCEICTSTMSEEDEVCPTCGMPDGTPEDVDDADGIGPWTIVRTVSTVIEAELMAGRLRNEGIPAVVLSQVDSTRNFTVGGLAIARVYVPAVSHSRADAILMVDADEEDDVDDDLQE